MLRVTRQQQSLKYTHHRSLVEMRQPEWIAAKALGASVNSYTHNPKMKWGKRTSGGGLERAHMNLWHTDLSPETNIMMAPHAQLEEYHKLLGRKSHHGMSGILRISQYSDTDLTMDQRFKGAQRKSIANLVDEPFWNTIMYPLSTLRQRSAPERNYNASAGINLTTLGELNSTTEHGGTIPAAVLDAQQQFMKSNGALAKTKNGTAPLVDPISTYQLMTIKTKQHVEAYWKNLAHVIKVHRPAVGDLDGPFQSRSARTVHDTFVKFQDAVRSHNFQDSYLVRHLKETHPTELKDLFGIFLEMEANYVNHDFCPRCSLPFATTRYCGEGDANTPFRSDRGRWAPHKSWGKEWYDVVVRRAEQLWYRAIEDPLFGTPEHTQMQCEQMLKVYCKTKSRGKAIHFLNSLRGSLEFLQGKIKITDKMQKDIDTLLDETPHPHLLTNGFRTQPNGNASYLLNSVQQASGTAPTAAMKATTLPLSPLQLCIDLEMGKFRRDQKEQGAIRLPPKGWRINTENIVPYKLGPNGKVSNWRQVKEGIEKSFLDTGLPEEAYTSDELREINYLVDHLATRDEKKAALRKAFEEERDAIRKEGRLNKKDKVVFPTVEYFAIFDVTDAALAPFNGFVMNSASSSSSSDATTARLKYGMPITAERKQFVDPKNVTLAIAQTTYTFDTTDDACKVYGFLHGQVVNYTNSDSGDKMTVIVLGVDTQSSAQHQLLAVDAQGNPHSLGYDILDVRKRCVGITVDPARPRRSPKILSSQLRATESFANGVVIGVNKGGELCVSWDGGVATPLGMPDVMVSSQWRIFTSAAAPSSTSTSSSTSSSEPFFPTPREPFSWVTPFRNDWSEERLEELKKAPWERERYVSLIQNKFTPVVKRFGYTQHITQDDFVTKEYKDRLLSKQFFTNPQAFEVIPDVQQKAVRFGGKDEAAVRLHGLPTADRNELENGWDAVPDVSPQEVALIEQGLKDISGKRPGNYIKSATETSKLKLNESWWTGLNYGWQQEAKEQNFLENGADRKTIDGTKNPFGGTLPAFNTTYGIAERIREVSEDFSKGFGLGGVNHQSPTADRNYLNTLGFESLNAEALGYSNVLLRLFNEKIGASSIYSVAESLANSHRVDPRDLLLSLNEWRTAGRNPSPMLKRVLADYLSAEIAAYNNSAVNGTDLIDVNGFGSGVASDLSGAKSFATSRAGMVTSSSASPWLDVDRDAFKTDFFLRQRDIAGGSSDSAGAGGAGGGAGGSAVSGFVIARIVEIKMRNASATSDDSLAAHCASTVANQFALALSESVGKGIPLRTLQAAQAQRRNDRNAGVAIQLIRGDVLKGLLRSAGLGDTAVNTIISGLSQTSDVLPLSQDFAVPLQNILTWKGPSLSAGAGAPSAKDPTDPKSRRPAPPRPAISRSSIVDDVVGGKIGSATNTSIATQGRFSQNPVYTTLLNSSQEGAALDFAYAAGENMKNRVLRKEFVDACRGVIKVPSFAPASGAPSSSLSSETVEETAELFYNALYDRYCEGLWVPTFEEASSMFVKFLSNCQSDPRMLIEYFNFKGEEHQLLGGSGSGRKHHNSTEVSGLNKKRMVNIPFTFDNVTIEALKAKQMAKLLQEFPPMFYFIANRNNAAASSAASKAATDDANATASASSADAAAATNGATSSSSSSSAAGLSGFKKSSSTAASSDASSASASASSSTTAIANTINSQNYFDAVARSAIDGVDPFIGSNDEIAAKDLYAKVKAAFPTAGNLQQQRTNNNSGSGAISAPPAPNSVYSGPFTSFIGNELQTLLIFRQWCDTVFPLLPAHWNTLERNRKTADYANEFVARKIERFKNIMANDSNEAMEREFRSNAERYWRKVIDGKGLEEFTAAMPGGSSGDVSSGGEGGIASAAAAVDRQSSAQTNTSRRVSYSGGRGRGGNFNRYNNNNSSAAAGGGGRQQQQQQNSQSGEALRQGLSSSRGASSSGISGMMAGRGGTGGGRSSGFSRGSGRGRSN